MRAGERVVAQRVIDGDTLLLTDGRRLRLLGMNAPELHPRAGHSADPFAEQARTAVAALLGNRRQLLLITDTQLHDRYGRELAHAFLTDGTSLTAALLRLGLANSLIIPPNVQFSGCYLQAENDARAHDRGIWSTPQFRPVEANSTAAAQPGNHVVQGIVTGVRPIQRGLFLDLGSQFSVRVKSAGSARSTRVVADSLLGKRIGVRGRVYHRHGRSYVSVHSLTSLWAF